MPRMTRRGGIHILYVALLIKVNIFSTSYPNCEKLRYAQRQILRATV